MSENYYTNDTHTEHPTALRPVRYRKAKHAAADRQSAACREAREASVQRRKRDRQPEGGA